MRDFPLSVRIYTVLLVLATVALWVVLLPGSRLPDGAHLTLALGLIGLVIAAGMWNVVISDKVEMTVEDSAVFAAILLFEPGIAMLIASFGSIISSLLMRKSLFSTVANPLRIALAAGCGGLVLSFFLGDEIIRLNEPTHLALALLAALVTAVVVTSNVMVVSALERRRPLYSELRDEHWKVVALVFCLEFVYGLLIVMVASSAVWGVVLFAIPLYAAHAVVGDQERSRRRAQEVLVRTEDRLARAQNIAHVGSWEWSAGSEDMLWSDEVYRILGYEPQGCPATLHEHLERVDAEDRTRVRRAFDAALSGDIKPLDIEYAVVRPDGSMRHVYVRGEIERDESGGTVKLLGTVHDITKRKALEQQLAHQAYHDSLTDLPNRALFTEHLEAALSRMKRREGELAVLFLDLDGFKQINDEFGHDMGDVLLVETSARLRSCLRPHDTLARLGGDEFVLLLDGEIDEGQIIGVTERIIEAIGVPHMILGREVRVSGSIGIALSRSTSTPDRLLREADIAMYEAKRGGKNQYRFYRKLRYDREPRSSQSVSSATGGETVS